MEEPATLLDLLARGEQRSERTAFVYRTGFRRFTVTYTEAVRAARAVAASLQSHDLPRGGRVLLWGPNSPAWTVSFFGILAAGLVVVPADMRATVDTVRAIARRAGVSAVIQTRLHSDLGLGVPALDLEEFLFPTQHAAPSSPARATPPLRPDDTAEILFTSGTTGDPKGVVLTHRNMLSNIAALERVIRVDPAWSFLSVLPLSHIFEQVVGFLILWKTGARITYLRTVKPSEIFAALRHERPTHLVAVPRLLALFRDRILHTAAERGLRGLFVVLLKRAPSFPLSIRRQLFRSVHRRFGGRIDFLVVGGAPLPVELEAFWNALGIPLVQGYGLTETAPILTCNTPTEQRRGSVGKPLPAQDLTVAPDDEILARGPHVFRGYYRDPETTAAAFTADGWFRTGDSGELRDGWLYLKGRKKDVIVPSHGMNVYPEDLEAVLTATGGVRDAAVIGLPGPEGERVHAVLLLAAGAPAPAAIVAAANARLDPTQQIQSFSVWEGEDFPRTPTLKVRKFLVRGSVLHRQKPEARGEHRGERADRLRAIVATATGSPLDAILPEKKLASDLGLDSLGRLELVALLEMEFGVDVDEGDLTADTTVADLQQLVRAARMVRQPLSWHWPFHRRLRPVRAFVQRLLLFPLLRFTAQIDVEGAAHLQRVRGPAIFVANHMSHLDALVILAVLPASIRRRTAILVRAETFEQARGTSRLLRGVGFFFMNFVVLPVLLPQQRGFRHALARAGAVVDEGGSLVIFPEGGRGPGRPLQPFAVGVAYAAVEFRAPVVPLFMHGTAALLPPGKSLQWRYLFRHPRARISVRVGPLLSSPHAGALPTVTRDIQRAVEALAIPSHSS